MTSRTFWAPHAWIDGQWQADVRLDVEDGIFMALASSIARSTIPQAEILAGPVLPAMVNAHSHAFQRAFVGLAETRNNAEDDFWSWREKMYAVARRITPDQLQAIAAQLFLELLAGGYTHICEFHYLQHAPDGTAYADPLTMAWAIRAAADEVGVGTTMLPVLYAHAGFRTTGLRAEQQRFKTDARWVADAHAGLAARTTPMHAAGVALHSLRAAHAQDCRDLLTHVAAHTPIHIHVSEQVAEVDESLAVLGTTPIDWLASHIGLDPRWHLVHATHATAGEVQAVARAGAAVVLCPTTEANLGDGWTDGLAWRDAPIGLTLGSDSQVCRSWTEEIRCFEYGQRLRVRQRNIGATPPGQVATADAWFTRFMGAGARAAGLPAWGLRPGARADFIVLDQEAAALEREPPLWLSGLVFGGHTNAFADVYVAGERRVHGGTHPRRQAIRKRFRSAMKELF
jgi:formimidoylglutamate deiminase